MSTFGNIGNEGQRGYDDGNGDVNTHGNTGNEPSRHRGVIDISVRHDNEDPVSMQANLNWTLDKLHSSSAIIWNMDPSQCHSSCDGVPLSGSRRIRETRITNDSTVILYEGEGTPTPGGTKNEPKNKKDNKVQILIEKPDGKTRPMKVDLGWSQDLLVDEVAASFNIVKGQFFLLFGSKQLEGKGILLEAGIRKESRVIVCLRLCGGSQ